MFVQFKVKNFLSFREESVLDMSAIKAYKEHAYNLIDIGTKENFLKVAAIYGANASGKSNLFFAMGTFQGIVSKSFNNVDDKNAPAIVSGYQPFAFCEEKGNIEFELIQITDGVEYKYGFEFNDKEIVTEWLYKKDLYTNRTSTILERSGETISFGARVRSICDVYKGQIPTETLVLSFFNKLKLETPIFNVVYRGIMDTLVVSSDDYEDFFVVNHYLEKVIDDAKEELLLFLSAIDTGIKDISYEMKEKHTEFFSHHLGEDGKVHKLNLFNESQGTLKCISIYLDSMVAIGFGKSLFIDELNAKLHPLLLKFIIDLFHSKNNQQGQLIYTTHDTTLLDKKFFRRDQIWFVEKNQFGQSSLSALSDFKIRTDASFEKDYLSGVYGGIPLIRDMKAGE